MCRRPRIEARATDENAKGARAAKATEPAAQPRADIGALFGAAENPKADAAQAMNGTFGGIDVRVDKVTQSEGSTKVEAKLFDAKGNEVGKTERTFHRGNGDDPDARWVSHDLLYLDKDQQGAGFAQEFNAHMENAYRDSGVSHIRLEANIDVGGYAWARQGYDFADQATAEKIRDRAAGILDTLKFALDFATPGTPEHARALSQAAGAQSYWIGSRTTSTARRATRHRSMCLKLAGNRVKAAPINGSASWRCSTRNGMASNGYDRRGETCPGTARAPATGRGRARRVDDQAIPDAPFERGPPGGIWL
jgi:hypothetical protein